MNNKKSPTAGLLFLRVGINMAVHSLSAFSFFLEFRLRLLSAGMFFRPGLYPRIFLGQVCKLPISWCLFAVLSAVQIHCRKLPHPLAFFITSREESSAISIHSSTNICAWACFACVNIDANAGFYNATFLSSARREMRICRNNLLHAIR